MSTPAPSPAAPAVTPDGPAPRPAAPAVSPDDPAPHPAGPAATPGDPAPAGSHAGDRRTQSRGPSVLARWPPGATPGFCQMAWSRARSRRGIRRPDRFQTVFDRTCSRSVCTSSFRPLVVLDPYISAKDAPKLGEDHV